jgi:hypothetical protein
MGVGWMVGGVKGRIDTRKGGRDVEVFDGVCLVHLCKARVTMYKLKALILACGISQSTNFTSFVKISCICLHAENYDTISIPYSFNSFEYINICL